MEQERDGNAMEKAGRRAILVPGDIQYAPHCKEIIDTAVSQFGGIDVLVNNAAHQASFNDIGEIPNEEWEVTSVPTSMRCSI
ncbi:hypothetical protein GCM10010924_38230 [Rhizobium wenxiniae]|nr:hypothetical protein GCM10010924_38230 [Rhizobium wenxiniae]